MDYNPNKSVFVKRRFLCLHIVFFFISLSVFSQEILTVKWEEGKDNLYKYPAAFSVSDKNGNPVKGANIFLEDNNIGTSDEKGQLISDKANNAVAKYALIAEQGENKSKKYTYHVKNSNHPTLVFVTFGSDPKSSMSFTWHTDTSTKKTIVECVKADDDKGFSGKSVLIAKGNSYPHDFVDAEGEKAITRRANVHKAAITGLSPDTKYRYRVGNGEAWEEGTFVTAVKKNEPFRFLFIPDIQEYARKNYVNNFKEVIKRAFAMYPDSKFMVQAGDAVEKGGNSQEYEWLYEIGEQYFRNIPLVPVLGNHEAINVKNNEHFVNYFNNIPNETQSYGKGSAYAFDYANLHVLVLDITSFSGIVKDEKELRKALDWIESKLKNISSDQWQIVMMHQSIYSTARNYKDERSFLAPLFEKYKVDLVLTGHDHVYMRTDRLKYDAQSNDGISANENEFGTTYVIGGSSSRKMYDQKYTKPYQAIVISKNEFENRHPNTIYKPMTTQNFMIVEVSADSLRVKTISAEGKIWDKFTLNHKK